MLQAFLNRLHASALAAQQGPYSAAPLAGNAASMAPSSHEPTTDPSEPVEADSHAGLSHTYRLADPASPLSCQAAAETVTQPGGKAAMALSAGDPPVVEMAAAPLSPEATGPEGTTALNTATLQGSGPSAGACQADAAAVAVRDSLAADGQDAVVSMSAAAAAAAAEPASGVDVGAVPDAPLSLEWLRSAPPDVAAAFLMSVEGMVTFRVSESSMYATRPHLDSCRAVQWKAQLLTGQYSGWLLVGASLTCLLARNGCPPSCSCCVYNVGGPGMSAPWSTDQPHRRKIGRKVEQGMLIICRHTQLVAVVCTVSPKAFSPLSPAHMLCRHHRNANAESAHTQ